MIFINSNRLETQKKELRRVTFEDFEYCADIIMYRWSYRNDVCHLVPDKLFLQHVREVQQLLQPQSIFEKYLADVNMLICEEMKDRKRVLDRPGTPLRHVLHMASDMIQEKEFRSVFVYFVERFVVPFQHLRYTIDDVDCFFKCCIHALENPKTTNEIDLGKTRLSFESFIGGLGQCVLRFYSLLAASSPPR
jgi:hypothetical protein